MSDDIALDDTITFGDLRLLIDLVAVLETPQTLTAAEKHLQQNGYPTLDLSAWLLKMEESLGGPKARGNLIVDRGSGKKQAVLQQPIASEIAKSARLVRSTWHEQVERVETARQRVNVAVSNAIASSFLPRVLTETSYLKDHPNVDIKIMEGEPLENIRRVSQSEAHFAVGPKGNTGQNCECQTLCIWKRVLLFRADNTSHCRFNSISLDQLWAALQNETVIRPPRSVMPELDEFLGVPKKGRIIKLSQAVHRRDFVLAGIGVAISHIDAMMGSDDKLIDTVDLTDALGHTEICIFFPKSKGKRIVPKPHVQALADAVIKMFEPQSK